MVLHNNNYYYCLMFFMIHFLLINSISMLSSCRSYCGNITVSYPFGLQPGCGHAVFRDLLYCINDNLMMHIPSGSYRVLDIDYAYKTLRLEDSTMSDCYSLNLNNNANGFFVEPWRAQYLEPHPDNLFLLLECHADSPLFQGFPTKHLPCRNIADMSCQQYYRCPAWLERVHQKRDSAYGSLTPVAPECCGVEFGSLRAINLSHLQCQGYSSAYSLAPIRLQGPGAWNYGIRVKYSMPNGQEGFCGACEATGGLCGYDHETGDNLCICQHYNSTANCDSIAEKGGVITTLSSSKKWIAFAYQLQGFCLMALWYI